MNNHVAVIVCLLVLITTTPLLFATGKEVSSPSSLSSTQVLAPNCTRRCGNMDIWYPFGVEDGCYLKDGASSIFEFFKVNCSNSFSPPKPFWGGSSVELLSIAVNSSELRLKYSIAYACFNKQNQSTGSFESWTATGQFTFSSTKNIFVVMGCDSYAWFTGYQWVPERKLARDYYTGCMSKCNAEEDVADGECNGVGCCQLPLPDGLYNVTTETSSFNNHARVVDFNPCSAAFLVEKAEFKFYARNLSRRMDLLPSHSSEVPAVVDWSIGKHSCSYGQAQGLSLCKNNTDCQDHLSQEGYICKCKPGFHGNPYHPHGCIDINECESDSHNCEKSEYCVNDIGKHHCQCPNGYRGKGTMTDRCISLTPIFITTGGGSAVIVLLSIAFLMYMKREKGKLRKLQERFFEQNGGLLLHQKIVRLNVPLKIFTEQSLQNATDNYNDKYIIGRGGFGVVYKGTVPVNQHVAIKKSLKVDPSHAEEFVNEVVVLSQINNINVVKLLGCCLETEVPLLVYEYITNGTLYAHLNDAVKASILTWSTRLSIALEVANVLSYLHNTISPPIIHRDMKSMNILLDDNYTVKVADFGASVVVPTDEDQVATMIVGTLGYLDPQYLQMGSLTQKSDVYSFGVVLVELLTREKAFSNDRPETKIFLAVRFCAKMEQGKLLDILDKSIVGEGTITQIQQVADLAKQCLIIDRDKRPPMKEVAMELQIINRKGLHPWNKQDDQSFQDDDHVSLLGELRGSGKDGNSSRVQSDSYVLQPISSLGS